MTTKPILTKLAYLLWVRPFINIFKYNLQQLLLSVLAGAVILAVTFILFNFGVIQYLVGTPEHRMIIRLAGLWCSFSILFGILGKISLPKDFQMLCESVPQKMYYLVAYSFLAKIVNIPRTIDKCMIMAGACLGMRMQGIKILQICAGITVFLSFCRCLQAMIQIGMFGKLYKSFSAFGLLCLVVLNTGSHFYDNISMRVAILFPQSLVIAALGNDLIFFHCCLIVILFYIIVMLYLIHRILNNIPQTLFFEKDDYENRIIRCLRNLVPERYRHFSMISSFHSAFYNMMLQGIVHALRDTLMLRHLFAEIVFIMLAAAIMRNPQEHVSMLFLCMLVSIPVLRCAMSSGNALKSMSTTLHLSRYNIRNAWAAYGSGACIAGIFIAIPLLCIAIAASICGSIQFGFEARKVVAFCLWMLGSILPVSMIVGIWFVTVISDSNAFMSRIPFIFRPIISTAIFFCLVLLPNFWTIELVSLPQMDYYFLHIFLYTVLFNIFIGSWLLRSTLRGLTSASILNWGLPIK